jgi:hypothetical protein
MNAVDRVDRVPPRPGEQPERRRRGEREFPDVEKREKHAPGTTPAAPRSTPVRDAGDEEEHIVDVRVSGRAFPTRQILPAAASAARPN